MCSRIFDLQPKRVPSGLLRPPPLCQLRLQSLCRCKDLSCDQLYCIESQRMQNKHHRLMSVQSQYVEFIFSRCIFLKHFFVLQICSHFLSTLFCPQKLKNLSFCRCLQAKGMGAVASYSAHPDACSQNFSWCTKLWTCCRCLRGGSCALAGLKGSYRECIIWIYWKGPKT